MNKISHTVDIAAPEETVWSKLVRWEDWPVWDQGMETISFDGPIAVGSIGRLKLKGGCYTYHMVLPDLAKKLPLWLSNFKRRCENF